MHFKEKRWPLHTALGWVLTRDPHYADRCGPHDFWPYLPPNVPYEALTDEHKSWRLLFDAMMDGRVPTFGRPTDQPDGEKRQLSLEDLERLDWGDADRMPGLRRRAATHDEDENRSSSDELAFADVHVSSDAMFVSFSPGSVPIAFGTAQIGAPQRPVGPDFMALPAAAYWIATKVPSRGW